MTKEERIIAIEKSHQTGETKIIKYKDEVEPLSVFNIDLDNLIYNPYNGRIRSSVLSYESRFNRSINLELEGDKELIEQYLYDSAFYKNEKTIESLEINGQQEVGIVTKDGVIIDGNRRALLLNILNRRNGTKIPFKAIVLKDELLNNEKDIILLETRFQMGVDSKVDYSPIEKYIRCYELKNTHGLSYEDIGLLMSEDARKIEEWLGILELMDDYLIRLGTPKIYTRLEKKEGHFVDLFVYLKSYTSSKSQTVNWDYSQNDIQKLKFTYFDYIRLGIPVQRARVIAKTKMSNSFFCQKSIWSLFVIEHQKILESYKETTFQELFKIDESKSFEDIARELDKEWREHLEEKLLNSLSFYESELKDLFEKYEPIKLLRRVYNNLLQIDKESIIDSSKVEAIELLNEINKITVEYINTISQK